MRSEVTLYLMYIEVLVSDPQIQSAQTNKQTNNNRVVII